MKKIEIISAKVDSEYIEPTIVFDVQMYFTYGITSLISVEGILKIGGKIISDLKGYITGSETRNLIIYNKENRDSNYNNADYVQYTKLVSKLSPLALEHIEKTKDKQQNNDVEFLLELSIKYVEINALKEDIYRGSFLNILFRKTNEYHIIKQSDWIRHYAPLLGIGNFMLLELYIPKEKKVDKFWQTFYNDLQDNLKKIEVSIRNGDWEKSITNARMFYENIKIGDDKVGNKKFKDQFTKLMLEKNHNQEGINNLYDGIWKFFDFISKYAHSKDQNGNPRPTPIPTKEDAYFVYAMALGLLNFFGKKIEKN